jgi:hypothetical protein
MLPFVVDERRKRSRKVRQPRNLANFWNDGRGCWPARRGLGGDPTGAVSLAGGVGASATSSTVPAGSSALTGSIQADHFASFTTPPPLVQVTQ